jgi:hypothetical protein
MKVYMPRQCALCNNEAAYALQVLGRTVGVGQSRKQRKMKLSGCFLLCEQCASDLDRYEQRVGWAAKESLKHVRRRLASTSSPLFDGVEA